jgi:hypothetical protein
MTYTIKSKKEQKEHSFYLLPEIKDEELESYRVKAEDYENETKHYKITPMQRLEIARQLQEMGIVKGTQRLVGLNNGLRVNRGKTNYDIFYDEGRDTYVVYKLTQKGFTDFEKEKFDDVHVEDLKEIIK